jgi:predicted  nucleic acid-binding Zn-ribbon protein
MTWHVTIENIAGIRSGDATLHRGTNAVRASNWQGKSSFLSAIKTAMGTATPLTEGQEHGRVELTTAESSIIIELSRQNGTVLREGNPYLPDEYDRVCAKLFAFLDEENEIRRAVRNDDNLEAVLTRPLDFENIDEQITELQREREKIDSELSQAEEAAARLPSLESTVSELESSLEELRAKRTELADPDESGDDLREELSRLRAERTQLDQRIERLERARESAQQRLAEKESELESLDIPSGEEFEEELVEARDALRKVERDAELLQSVYEANKRVLDEDRLDLLTDVTHDLLGDTAVCWVCGTEADRDAIASQLEELGNRITNLREQADEYTERVERLQTRRDDVKRARRRESELNTECRELRETVTDREASLTDAVERRDELENRIEELATQVQDTKEERTDIESEIKYTEAELEDTREELSTVEARASQRESLEQERAEITEELTTLRTRKETIKRRTRESFEETMAQIVQQFETGFEAARLTSDFELVVAREGREASLDALSEGEVELLGLIAALAGREAFDVASRVPVLLLDGLGGIAADNLATLVDYLTERAEYLVLTAYPEHTTFDGNELNPADWTVVSDDVTLET